MGGDFSIPKGINPQEDSRVKASMSDNLRLGHLQSLGHPVEEGKVCLEIEVNKFSNKVASWGGASPPSKNVPLGKVNPVIDGLNPEQSKGKQERKGSHYVYEG